MLNSVKLKNPQNVRSSLGAELMAKSERNYYLVFDDCQEK
jgi:hypothetical protein